MAGSGTRTWLYKTAEQYGLDIVYVVVCGLAAVGRPITVYSDEALAYAAVESLAGKHPELTKAATRPDSTELSRWELEAKSGRSFPALRLFESLVKIPYTEEEL